MLGIVDGFEMLVWLGVIGGILFVTAFWVWMLVDCAMKETTQGNDKLIWVLVILFTHWIGAAIYFFVRRPQRIREVGH